MVNLAITDTQGRRLVINIGGCKNFGHKYWGGKNFWKIYFQKKIFKSFLQFSQKILTTFFFSHQQLFSQKFTLFLENVQIYFLFFVFFFLCLCFFFLSCFFFLKIFFKFSSDYWGGKKGVLPHHPNYWGRMPGLPLQSLRLCRHP